MDTSKEYIKMCEEATEIQKCLDHYDYGSYLYLKDVNYVELVGRPNLYWLENYGSGKSCREWVSYYDESDHPEYYGNRIVWLPRQDQLQEIVTPIITENQKTTWSYIIVYDFKNWLEMGYKYLGLFNSMEQLWLAFVMNFMYEKKWNGSKWLTEEGKKLLRGFCDY